MKTVKELLREAKKDTKNAWVVLFEREFVRQNGRSALNCRFASLYHVLTAFATYKSSQGTEFWHKIMRSLRKSQP